MSCPIIHPVSLAEKEKIKLNEVIKDMHFSSNVCKRALILLALDNKNISNLSYGEIAVMLKTTTSTVSKVAREYFLYGLQYVLFRRYDKLSSKNIVHDMGTNEIVIKVACDKGPEDGDTWCVEVNIRK